MKREEAVALLKELIMLNLAMPSVVDLERNNHGRFDLIINADCNLPALRQFIAEKKFVLVEDKQKGYCVISKP